MLDFKFGAIAAALLGTMAVVPVAAQQSPPPEGNSTSANTPGASVPDETVARTGAALKQVTEIKDVYASKLAAAPTPDERARLGSQETEAAAKANQRAGTDNRSVQQRDEACAG